MRDRSALEIWEAALGELQVQVSKPNYRTWLERTTGLSYQDNRFVIGVPNTFISEYLSQNQRCLIEKTLIGLTNQNNIDIVFQINSTLQDPATSPGTKERAPMTRQASLLRLNTKYTFDTFVVGNCNRLAHAAALEVAENPGRSYNPLFIYGGVGLGKTHLLQAIGHTALASNLQVLYVSAERFTSEFIAALREKNTEAFNSKYRTVDILLIDDIHFLAGKEQTQEMFFHTFNELHNGNRQIAVTSNTLPKSISSLEDRLRSRFEWGIVVDIQPPEFETRLSILQAKAEQQGMNISSDVLDFLAHRIQQNIRELEGYLNRVIALAKLTRARLTPELAAQALKDFAGKKPKENTVTPGQVIDTVANCFQLKPPDLISRRRDKEAILARQIAIYLIKQETNCTLTKIGQELGGRNHATIIHAYEKVAGEIESNPYLQRKLSEIQQSLHLKARNKAA